MSKRGSKNAINFAGKAWGLSKRTASSRDKKLDKADKRKQRKKKKLDRSRKQFEKIAAKFDKHNSNEISEDIYNTFEKRFVSIKKNTIRTKAMQNVKSFRLYCKKYNENFDLQTYFQKEYHLTDFKKQYPDVYYFNVLKKKMTGEY